MYNESRATDGQFITIDQRSLAKIVHDPNIHTMILECIKIICTIKQTSLANPGAVVKRLLDNMKVKWCAYFTEFPHIYAIAAILDPGVKLEDVQFDVPYYVNDCKRILERLCEDYGVVIQPQPVGSSMDCINKPSWVYNLHPRSNAGDVKPEEGGHIFNMNGAGFEGSSTPLTDVFFSTNIYGSTKCGLQQLQAS
ncbi:putative chlorophyll(ide) b reductase NYC1 chloroplastic [Bienertia sinuspersici]